MRVVALPTTHPVDELAAATLVAPWEDIVVRVNGKRVELALR